MSTPPSFLTPQTLLSLLSTLLILLTAYLFSLRLLPTSSPTKLRGLFIWHIADGLTHLTLEASYLYNVFFVSAPIVASADYPHPASLPSSPPAGLMVGTPSYLYGDRDRAHGPAYGTNPTARLWQEYAKADRRWGGADLTVVSLELLTVGLAGPLALYVGMLIARGAGGPRERGADGAKLWFWASLLATGELYGGFMTFAPEWLSGMENLDGGNWMYMWLYLVFFNMLWVFIPFWVLYEAYGNIKKAFVTAAAVREKKSE
ncbi:MAG: hypothetical protein MMC23_000647 [Stictis urceolatum]|nr:hypothetical protein [Stictis urceolata]